MEKWIIGFHWFQLFFLRIEGLSMDLNINYRWKTQSSLWELLKRQYDREDDVGIAFSVGKNISSILFDNVWLLRDFVRLWVDWELKEI